VIADLTSLRSLILTDTGIRDISAVSEFSHLARLQIRPGEISDISALTKLEELRRVSIINNLVVNLPTFTSTVLHNLARVYGDPAIGRVVGCVTCCFEKT
jgi:Leucine-rich repeat (LRR) protein